MATISQEQGFCFLEKLSDAKRIVDDGTFKDSLCEEICLVKDLFNKVMREQLHSPPYHIDNELLNRIYKIIDILSPRGALTEILKLKQELEKSEKKIAELKNELEAKGRTVDHLNGIIEKRNTEIGELTKTIKEQTAIIETLNDAVNTLAATYQDQPAQSKQK